MMEWPYFLPFFDLRDGYSHTAADNILRTSMDVGPTKARRRTVSAPRTVGGTAYMTREEYRIAVQFIDEQLGGGVLTFTAADVVTGEPQVYRLLAPLSVQPMGLGWRVSAQLEILP